MEHVPRNDFSHQGEPRRCAEWWHRECNDSRRNNTRLLTIYRRTRPATDLNVYLNSQTVYNRLCRSKSESHKRDLLCKLKDVCKDRAGNNFWSTIKSNSQRNGHNNSGNITPKRWHDYFEALYTVGNEPGNHFYNMANEFIETHDNDCELCNINISCNVNDVSLNSEISPDEIENVKQLPKNKSAGIDGFYTS